MINAVIWIIISHAEDLIAIFFFLNYLYQNDFSVAHKSYISAFRLPDMDEWCKWENVLTPTKSKQIKKNVWIKFFNLLFSLKDHDDVIKWEHFPHYWPFVWGMHRSPVNSPHKGQWRGALIFSLICAWINGWLNNRKAGNLRCHRAHYDVTVIILRVKGQQTPTGIMLYMFMKIYDTRRMKSLSTRLVVQRFVYKMDVKCCKEQVA